MNTRPKILFVDDEVRVLRSLNSIFRHDDYDVFIASSGKEALSLLGKQPIDVVVSDQRMPEMTGDEFLSRVRRHYPQTVRILLTGYVDKKAIVQTINGGEIFRYISKPWDINDIRQTMADAVQLSKKIQAAQSLSEQSETEVAEVLPGSSTLNNTEISVTTKVAHASRKTPIDASKTAIVLMDKDQNVRNSIHAIARRFGLKIYTASSPAQAVRIFNIRKEVGIAIVGINFDPAETIEALELFKQQRPDISIIAMTDFIDAGIAVKLINLSLVFRYLEKPVEPKEFERAVLAAIKRHHMLKDMESLQKNYQQAFLNSGVSKIRSMFRKSA